MTSTIGSNVHHDTAGDGSQTAFKLPLAAVLRACLCLWVLAGSAHAGQWPRFRGPNGTGISHLQGVPVQWSQNDYEWIVDLPGKGHSSPVIWDDHLFLTSGMDEGERMLLCLNALTGETRWTQQLRFEGEHKLHKKNSYGSGSAVTDGERVYVSFADNDHYLITAFDFNDGSPEWTQDLGTFRSQHGHGQSPMLYGDLVIATNDQMGPSFIVALDRKTGKEVWKSPRLERRTSYSTPMILEISGQTQLICISGATGLSGLNPETGEELWASGELPLRTVASPVFGNGVLIASCGQGGRGTNMVAVEPSLTGKSAEVRTRWPRTTNLPYVPTPIISEGILYLWNDDGVVCSVDLQTGRNINRIRVGGNYSSSPVLIDGKLYCPSEEGEIAVVSTTPELKMLGKSPLGDQTHSTPAVANGRVYFRGFHTLACLKARTVD